MTTINFLVARDESPTLNSAMVNLLIALLVLVVVGLVCLAALFFVRRMRNKAKKAQPELPLYHEKRSSNYRRLTISTRPDSAVVYSEKEAFLSDKSLSPPDSPIPEIRITFPEEIDEHGKTQSGRVVVVRVGETSIGLEPLQEDLPPYERENNGRFHSLDLDRIGGLKEKDVEAKQWS